MGKTLTPEQIAEGWQLYTGNGNPPFRDGSPFATVFQLGYFRNGELCMTGPIADKKASEVFWPDYHAYRTFSPVRPLSAEPVAWRVKFQDGQYVTYGYEEAATKAAHAERPNYELEVEPLFTSPPDQSARIAELEKACEAKDKSISNLQSVVAHRGRQIDKLQRSEPHRTADVRRELSAEIADLRARLAKAVSPSALIDALVTEAGWTEDDLTECSWSQIWSDIKDIADARAAQFVKANSEAGQ